MPVKQPTLLLELPSSDLILGKLLGSFFVDAGSPVHLIHITAIRLYIL